MNHTTTMIFSWICLSKSDVNHATFQTHPPSSNVDNPDSSSKKDKYEYQLNEFHEPIWNLASFVEWTFRFLVSIIPKGCRKNNGTSSPWLVEWCPCFSPPWSRFPDPFLSDNGNDCRCRSTRGCRTQGKHRDVISLIRCTLVFYTNPGYFVEESTTVTIEWWRIHPSTPMMVQFVCLTSTCWCFLKTTWWLCRKNPTAW